VTSLDGEALGLNGRQEISGGRLLSSRTPASADRAATILRLAAMNLSRTQTALGAFYRRLASHPRRAAPPTTAHSLALQLIDLSTGELVEGTVS
jgi:hypothetical protein